MNRSSLNALVFICLLIFMLAPALAQTQKKAIEQVLTQYPELKATGPPPVKSAVAANVNDNDPCKTSTECISKCCFTTTNRCLASRIKANYPHYRCVGELP